MNYCPCGVVTGFLKTEGPQGQMLATVVQFSLQKQEAEMNTLKLITLSFITKIEFGDCIYHYTASLLWKMLCRGTWRFSHLKTLSEEYYVL